MPSALGGARAGPARSPVADLGIDAETLERHDRRRHVVAQRRAHGEFGNDDRRPLVDGREIERRLRSGCRRRCDRAAELGVAEPIRDAVHPAVDAFAGLDAYARSTVLRPRRGTPRTRRRADVPSAARARARSRRRAKRRSRRLSFDRRPVPPRRPSTCRSCRRSTWRIRASRSSTCARVITKAAPTQRERRDGDRRRRRQRQRAGARHDEHCDRGGQRFRRVGDVPDTNVAADDRRAPPRRNGVRPRRLAPRPADSRASPRCASRWMSATRVRAGRVVATTVIGCATLSVPAYTRAPTALRDRARFAGQRRFVDLRSSPSTTSPSTAMRDPDGTTMRSPGRIASSGIGLDAIRPIRDAPIPATARANGRTRTRRRRAAVRGYRAPSNRKTNIVIESK